MDTRNGRGSSASILRDLWEEYEAQRELHKTLRQAKLVSLAAKRALQIDAVKALARAKRSVIKMTLKGAGRRIAYAAVQNELRQAIRAGNARIREERRALASDTRQLAWVDWLQQQAGHGRNDALEALRVTRGRGRANTLSASRTAAVAPPLEASEKVQNSLRGCDRLGSARGYTNAGEQLSFSSRFGV